MGWRDVGDRHCPVTAQHTTSALGLTSIPGLHTRVRSVCEGSVAVLTLVGVLHVGLDGRSLVGLPVARHHRVSHELLCTHMYSSDQTPNR